MATSSQAPGVVNAHEVYTLPELQERLQLGEWAMRQARRSGLRMVKIGRRKYVKGADFLDYLDRQAKQGGRSS